MKKTALIAVAGAVALGGAAYADYSKIQETYVQGAFSDADDDWLRITANRYGDCGEYGSQGLRRIDVLVARYNALGEALSSGNEQAAMTAAKRLSAAIEGSTRFESCWDSVSRKQGIKSSFKRQVAKN